MALEDAPSSPSCSLRRDVVDDAAVERRSTTAGIARVRTVVRGLRADSASGCSTGIRDADVPGLVGQHR